MSEKVVSLNPSQLQVLSWVRDGCPDGVYKDWSHRISAGTLHSRIAYVCSEMRGRNSPKISRSKAAAQAMARLFPAAVVGNSWVSRRAPVVAARIEQTWLRACVSPPTTGRWHE